jgi:hypothetical protein
MTEDEKKFASEQAQMLNLLVKRIQRSQPMSVFRGDLGSKIEALNLEARKTGPVFPPQFLDSDEIDALKKLVKQQHDAAQKVLSGIKEPNLEQWLNIEAVVKTSK